MLKVLFVLVPLLAVCGAQSYAYSAVLDANGNFIIRWNLLTAQKKFEMQLEAKTQGWLSLMIAAKDGSYADVWWGGYNDASAMGYLQDWHFDLTGGAHGSPVPDASPDLILQSASYSTTTNVTTIILKRSIDTGDMDDVAITPGPLRLGWSWSESDDPSTVHADGGFVTLPLIPAA